MSSSTSTVLEPPFDGRGAYGVSPEQPPRTPRRHSRPVDRALHVGRRRRIGLLVVFLVASTFLGWTAATAGNRAQFGGYPDYYAELAQGFLHGELSIPTLPPKALTSLPNPYDQNANAPFRGQFGDLALYKGHLYVDWGPTPAIVLYLPWRVLFNGQPSGNLATWLFSIAGLAFALIALERLVDRFLPAVRARWVVVGGLALAFEGAVPFLNREPDNYEVAVACAFCFAMLGVLLLSVSGIGDRVRWWRIGGASLAFGLAAATRQDLTLLGLLFIPVAVVFWQRERPRGRRLLAVYGPLLGPFLAVMVLLVLYNVARFGSPTQIGESYQLAGFNPQQTPYYQAGYVLPSLYFYLVSPIHWTLAFPFFEIPPPVPPISGPPAYTPEIIVGIVTSAPIAAMLVVAPFALWRRLPRALVLALVSMVLTGLAIVALISWSIPGGSERYVPDFSMLLLLPAVLCWLAWSPRPRLGRIAVRAVGTVLVVYGLLIGIAISITGYYNQISVTQPALYNKLVSATSSLAPFVTQILGYPIVADANNPSGIVTAVHWDKFGVGTLVYMRFSSTPATFTVIAPRRGTWALTGSIGPGPQYGDAGTSSILVVIRDATGIRRYRYLNGEGNYPVTLNKGWNTFSLWIKVAHKNLPGSDQVLSASGFEFGGHCVVDNRFGPGANPQGQYCAIPMSSKVAQPAAKG